MIFLVAASAVAGASLNGSAYPVESMLGEARAACEVVFASKDAGALTATGWKEIQPKPGSWLASELSDNWDSVGTPHRQFFKDVEGRPFFAIFGTDQDPKFSQTICTVRDPSAVLKADSSRIERWAERAPIAPAFALPTLKGMDDVSLRKRWVPGLNPNSAETQVNYAVGFGLTYFAVRIEEGTRAQ